MYQQLKKDISDKEDIRGRITDLNKLVDVDNLVNEEKIHRETIEEIYGDIYEIIETSIQKDEYLLDKYNKVAKASNLLFEVGLLTSLLTISVIKEQIKRNKKKRG